MGQPTKILAVITTKKENIMPGGAPVFITENRETLQKMGFSLSKTLNASAHEVDLDTMIIVAH
ncbi:capping complex subunit for YIEGIA [Neobacillus vireti]|uniref:capping complex subunit for YIEGIA n=1 Tax=Neobacillus vireti TaxID=220686 RepID=UPI003000E448